MGSQKKKNQNLLDKQYDQTQRDYNIPLGKAESYGNKAYTFQQEMIPGLMDRYNNYADTGGFDEGEYDKLFGSMGAGGGAGDLGIDESKFGTALKGYEDYAANGGNVDAAGIRARANSVIPSFYKTLGNEQSRRRLVNPYSPSFDAEQANMARQAGQQSVENVRNTELDIADKIDRNRQFGISGLGSLQQAIQGMQQQGKISAANINESAAGRRQSGELALINAKQQGKLAGLGGLQNMYQIQDDDARHYLDTQIGALGQRDSSLTNNIAARNAKGSDWWKYLAQAGGTAAAAYFGA